jgi:hypothetical protein
LEVLVDNTKTNKKKVTVKQRGFPRNKNKISSIKSNVAKNKKTNKKKVTVKQQGFPRNRNKIGSIKSNVARKVHTKQVILFDLVFCLS